MNRTQAKARFTELTGLPAKKKAVHTGIWQQGGKLKDWVEFSWNYELILTPTFDPRTTCYWVSIVKYLETLQEAA